MRIFISYSSKYRELCERLQLALEADGRHQVFVDRSELQPGQPFDETLREGIAECDLLLFLLSPESVAAGSYALAELSLAKQRWRHPGGRVLPVKVAPVPKDAIPPYLRAVTILEPQGDVVAETVAAVDALRPASRRRRLLAGLAIAVALGGGLAAVAGSNWQAQRAQQAQAVTLTRTAQQLCDAGNHALAWQRLDEAVARHPGHAPLRAAREDCGMRWLREIHVTAGKETFTDIVNRVLPVLAEGSTTASGRRAADLLAHMGWADHLRAREGAIRMDPAAYYRQSLAAEAGNVFGHAMWGHLTLVARGPIDDARRHFASALASGREAAYVRNLQFAALLYHPEPAAMAEATRAADDVRQRGDTLPPDTAERLWTRAYYSGLLSSDGRTEFVSALRTQPAPADPVATFAWLYPEQQVREDRRLLWRHFMASLEEVAGNRPAARARFESLRDELKRARSSGRVLDETLAALKRLQGP